MAIKGITYPKTSWLFQERPVTSAKLNTWDDRIEAALEVICLLLSKAWGGGDGVIRTPDSGGLYVSALSTPAMSVKVDPGYAFISGYPYRLALSLSGPTVVAPSTNPRIDLLQAQLSTWSINVKQGTEAATPAAPAADADCLPLAQLYLRPGMTSIKSSDDSVNGYIIDIRIFI